jgi:hypothetical protein
MSLLLVLDVFIKALIKILQYVSPIRIVGHKNATRNNSVAKCRQKAVDF